jgi:hypothetical protein
VPKMQDSDILRSVPGEDSHMIQWHWTLINCVQWQCWLDKLLW